MLITVFTATYNRGYCLENLYKSLLKQTYKNFEWIVIDDGSSDDTEFLINKFKKEGFLNLRYYKQENKGKYSCINKGIDIVNSDLFFMVDSDDYISNNALEKICEWVNDIKIKTNKDSFIGVAGLRGYENNKVIGTSTNKEIIEATPADYRYKYKINGDRAEVFFTKKLKKYKFPRIDGVKNFQTEAILFNQMSIDKQLISWHNEIIYFTEYLEDGLSKNLYKIKLQNWNGYIYYYNQILTLKMPFIEKVKQIANYYRVGLQIKNTFKLYIDINRHWISNICLPIGYIYYLKDKIRS